jgi:hypothetical protein
MEHEVVDGLDHCVAERLLDDAARSVGVHTTILSLDSPAGLP